MGEELHKKAEDAREKGDLLEALKLCDEATIEYSKEGNIEKFAEIQLSRALTLRHLSDKTNDKNFLVLAKFSAKSAVKICEKNDLSIGLAYAYYTLGKCKESLELYDKAKECYEKALDLSDGFSDLIKAEMMTRLAALEYRLGDESSLDKFNESIEVLKSGEETYVKKVWLSGAYMHMANAMISKDQKDKASEYIKKAKEIIDSDSELVLRRGQLEKLEAQLN